MENTSLTPSPGTLYVVATPIGNLADLTDRARAILGGVDLVACEDTRTTGALLTRLGLRKDLVAYHEHNELEAAVRLADGQAVPTEPEWPSGIVRVYGPHRSFLALGRVTADGWLAPQRALGGPVRAGW